jgi:predicted dehydrogenase
MIKVGLLGGGLVVDGHLRGYERFPDVISVTAVADPVPASRERRAAELGATPYEDYRQLLAEADVDAVDVCLPHHLHADAVITAAGRGRHILCEKPLCLSAAEARSIAQAVEAAGVTLMCAHNQLFLPAVSAAKELIEAGALGRLYEVRTTDCFHHSFDPTTMGWRADARTSGGGELLDTGYHPAYLMLHLAGGAPVEATALLSTHRLTFSQGEDSAQVLFRFDNGVVGQLVTSWAYDPPACTERFSVVGERGALHSDGHTLAYGLRDGRSEELRFGLVDTFVEEIGHFADCVRHGRRPLHDHEQGIQTLSMILAAYESARTKTIATVPKIIESGFVR